MTDPRSTRATPELDEAPRVGGEGELLRPGRRQGADLVEVDGARVDLEARLAVGAAEVLEVGVARGRERGRGVGRAEPEEDAELGAQAAEAAQAGEALGVGQGDGAEQRAPGQQDREAVGEVLDLAGRPLEREDAEDRVGEAAPGGLGGEPARGLAQGLGARVDADEEDVRGEARAPLDEGAVAGADVEVERPVGARALGESSTVDPVFALAGDHEHVAEN